MLGESELAVLQVVLACYNMRLVSKILFESNGGLCECKQLLTSCVLLG